MSQEPRAEDGHGSRIIFLEQMCVRLDLCEGVIPFNVVFSLNREVLHMLQGRLRVPTLPTWSDLVVQDPESCLPGT